MWFGRGPGWGWGRGRWGYFPGYYGWAADPRYMAEVELQWLRQYEAYLDAELRVVRDRIAQLEGVVRGGDIQPPQTPPTP